MGNRQIIDAKPQKKIPINTLKIKQAPTLSTKFPDLVHKAPLHNKANGIKKVLMPTT